MELIKSSSQIMPYDSNPLKHIELVARNCYKSEDKITDNSYTKFVQKLKDRKHMAMLEFYPFYFHVSTSVATQLLYINNQPEINGDLMINDDRTKSYMEVSCNLRTAIMISKEYGGLAYSISQVYPQLLFLFESINKDNNVTLVTDMEVDMFLQYLTARFICDRGVTHELVRHRMCSFAQESTRYCNYGKEDVKFIIPSWTKYEEGIQENVTFDSEEAEGIMRFNMLSVEEDYQTLINTHKYTPQQARAILPNCLKTEIIVQARLSEWKHIFEQRCSKSAHPDMQELMIPFKKKVCEISSEYNDYFNS